MTIYAMKWAIVLAVLLMGRAACGPPPSNASRYGFYRHFDGLESIWGRESVANGRRVFGGKSAELSVFPAACVLLDRYWKARCSAAVVSPRWALTAAHCVSPEIAYVKFNARLPSSASSHVAAVQYLYKHPGYKLVQEDEGRGIDVTLLYHDLGLVRTRTDMNLATRSPPDALRSMRMYNPMELKAAEVQVLGYGRTERSSLGEELFAVVLRLVACERPAWRTCMCGVARDGDARGVCSGDSGGPVVYRSVQVGVTSMGPLECARPTRELTTATSVFTVLHGYVDLLNATIQDTESQLRMRKIGSGGTRGVPPLVALLVVPLAISTGAMMWPA